MKIIAVSLLIGAGALSMTAPASADGMDTHRRAKRVAVSPLVSPLAEAPYVLSYQTDGRRPISPPSPYVNMGNGVYVYGRVPYYDTYTYLPVRYPRY